MHPNQKKHQIITMNPNLIKIASPEVEGTGIVLPVHNIIVSSLHTIHGFKKVVIDSNRFPRNTASVIFIDPLLDLAFIEAPAGVIFPEIKTKPAENKAGVYGESLSFTNGYQSFKGQLIQPEENNELLKLITGDIKKCVLGSALFNRDNELTGIVTQLIENKQECKVIPYQLIKESIDKYLASKKRYAVRCPACRHISAVDEFIDLKCPQCGQSINQDLLYEKKLVQSAAVEKIEHIITKLNYELDLVRIGRNYWEILEGSALVRIRYNEHKEFINANAVLCKMPEKPLASIYEYLLMENNYLKGLSFSIQGQNIVLAMMQLHANSLNVDTAIKLFKYLLDKADDYDDTLIEMGAVALYDE